MQTTQATTRTRAEKALRTQAALVELLSKVALPGYYGAATLTFSLQDGHIQQVKIASEKLVK